MDIQLVYPVSIMDERYSSLRRTFDVKFHMVMIFNDGSYALIKTGNESTVCLVKENVAYIDKTFYNKITKNYGYQDLYSFLKIRNKFDIKRGIEKGNFVLADLRSKTILWT